LDKEVEEDFFMLHLGSIYLVVADINKSIDFYSKLLDIEVSCRNQNRFAEFHFEGHNISMLNPHFDEENPDKIISIGKYNKEFDFTGVTSAPNKNKFVLNFWIEDLQKEYDRIISLNISTKITNIKYFYSRTPYYYFQLKDPDDNIIEITGGYNGEVVK